MRIPIISALACIVVALVIAFAMIAVLFVRGDTATYREVSAMVSSEMSSHISGYVNDRPEVYFEATRDSNETIGDVSKLCLRRKTYHFQFLMTTPL